MNIESLLYSDCESLHDCLQKILFYNGLLWMSGHWHVGLGRLDMILYPYFIKDIDSGKETVASLRSQLKNFFLLLSRQTRAKSASLIGDTGQYVLLGGVDKDGSFVDNELTRIILDIFTEIKVPDPKLIIRVNDGTSDETWRKCIECLKTGIGSPLFMNDAQIMKKMTAFGYDSKDVWNVGTSACWEPLIIGESACQNNPFLSTIACNSLHRVLLSEKDYATFDELMKDVMKEISIDAPKVVEDYNYDSSPIMTLFSENCKKERKDFSHGGSKYMYQGVQVLSLPNLVDSLLNIKKYVFEQKLFTLHDCLSAINNNYEGYEDMRILFSQTSEEKFGADKESVLSLTQTIVDAYEEALAHTYANGNKVKFGLSSSNYIQLAKNTPATLDGRKAGMPYAVHLSPVSSNIDINSILRFSASIKYPKSCLNGNVVDFIIPTAYIQNNDKLIDIIKDSIHNGVYELQLNVMDKQTLIDAKKHPEKYPNLVVRVWGFSAYFNDLPEEYKDNLIARAETYEVA